MFYLSDSSSSERLQQTHGALHPAAGIEVGSGKRHITQNIIYFYFLLVEE